MREKVVGVVGPWSPDSRAIEFVRAEASSASDTGAAVPGDVTGAECEAVYMWALSRPTVVPWREQGAVDGFAVGAGGGRLCVAALLLLLLLCCWVWWWCLGAWIVPQKVRGSRRHQNRTG